MPRNYWMVVITPENYQVTKDQGFRVQGLRRNQKRKAQRIEVGDRMLFYLEKAQRFAATATATSTFFEEHSRHWKDQDPEEDYPYRVRIEPSVVLDDDLFIDARLIAYRMDYVKKWVPETWPLAFVGDLHLIPKLDFSLLEEEMEKLAAARARR